MTNEDHSGGATPDEAPMVGCSFCLRSMGEVGTLVAGPGVNICDECVALCRQVIDGKPQGLPRVAPWEMVTDLEVVLDTLPRVAAASTQVESSLAGWVHRARSLGASWAVVGEALDMTRQSAWERFSGEE